MLPSTPIKYSDIPNKILHALSVLKIFLILPVLQFHTFICLSSEQLAT